MPEHSMGTIESSGAAPGKARLSRITAVVAVILVAAYALVWLLSLGRLDVKDTAALAASLSYQLFALPREIWRNAKARQVEKMSSTLVMLGAASYVTATTRSALQPDWVDVMTRAAGATASLIIVAQLVYYAFKEPSERRSCLDCVELARYDSWPRPCACGGMFHIVRIRIEGGARAIEAACAECHRSVTTFESLLSVGRELRGYYCYLGYNVDEPDEGFVQVSPEEYVETARQLAVSQYTSFFAHPLDGPELGIVGCVTKSPLRRPFIDAFEDVVKLPAL